MSNPAFNRRYFAQLTVYQVLIAIQFILIFFSLRQFRRRQKAKKSVDKRMKWMFIIVMLLGTSIFLIVEWYGLADFMYDFAKYPYYCTSAAILGNIFLTTYLYMLYMFYLLRLLATFGKSTYALTDKQIKIIISIQTSIYAIFIALIAIFERTHEITENFAWSGKTKDYKQIIICKGTLFSILF